MINEEIKSCLECFSLDDERIKQILENGEIERLIEYASSEKRDEKKKYAEHYSTLSPENRYCLSYIYGMLQCDTDYCSPVAKWAASMPGSNIGIRPFINRGMVGYSDLWPIYAIHPECFVRKHVTLFYTDEDINSKKDALSMADAISGESSGISDLTAVELPNICWLDTIDARPRFAVSFSLSEESIRQEIRTSDGMTPIHKEEPYLIVIPKHGEYHSILGEVKRICSSILCPVLDVGYWCTK